MKRRLLSIAVFVAATLIVTTAGRGADRVNLRLPDGKYGKGELRHVNGVPVLLVEGTSDEMGQQIGALILKPAAELLKDRDKLLKGEGWDRMLPIALKVSTLILPRVPPEHLHELEVAAKVGGWPRDLLVFGNTFADIWKMCSALLIEPARSATSGPLFGRNLDWGTSFPLHDFTLVTIRRPTGKHAFASVGFIGLFGCLSGMNDSGLALAELAVGSARDGSPQVDLKGVPYMFTLRRVLEECTTVEEAERLVRSTPRTTRENWAICDKHRAVVLEVTPKTVVVRPAEEGICACTNHFRTKELAVDTSCERYPILAASRTIKRLTLDDVIEKMDAVANETTVQTMIFEPATLKVHLAYGLGPASQHPLRELPLETLFHTGAFPAEAGLAGHDQQVTPPQIAKDKAGFFAVRFRYRPVGHAGAVYLAGTFNKWKPSAWKMNGPDKGGYYEMSILLREGRYEYKFVIDGNTWRRDPGNDEQAGYYRNSVLHVGR
jgi:isopenicillin-N N-acyltransferase like protein